MEPKDRLCAALDFPSWREAEPFARAVAPAVGMLKVGLELFAADGPAAVRAAAALSRPVFLDLKLHDIPNTVEGAARSAARSGAALLTVHASGGPRLGEAAGRGAEQRHHRLSPGSGHGDEARRATAFWRRHRHGRHLRLAHLVRGAV